MAAGYSLEATGESLGGSVPLEERSSALVISPQLTERGQSRF